MQGAIWEQGEHNGTAQVESMPPTRAIPHCRWQHRTEISGKFELTKLKTAAHASPIYYYSSLFQGLLGSFAGCPVKLSAKNRDIYSRETNL